MGVPRVHVGSVSFWRGNRFKAQVSTLCLYMDPWARKGLAADGFTLIATVHSPSAEAFACFDDLLLSLNSSSKKSRRPLAWAPCLP